VDDGDTGPRSVRADWGIGIERGASDVSESALQSPRPMVWRLVPGATIHGTRDANWLAAHKRRRRSRAALARRVNERARFMMPSPRFCQPPPCPPPEGEGNCLGSPPQAREGNYSRAAA